ncbi:hypothetical protein [Streptosporangium sp. NPDC087985]|uniref:hypothetical protein n=1 Tax=Streptosporangium sp. NPDC087985 TaxID=3366196 RepID=UPI0037FE46B8
MRQEIKKKPTDVTDGGIPSARMTELRQALKSSLENARPRPATPYYTQFSRILRAGLLDLLRERKTVDDFITDTAPILRKTLKGR